MKKVFLFLCAGFGFTMNANASLLNDGSMTLTISQGTAVCSEGGVYPNCDYGIVEATGGSYYNIDGNMRGLLSGNQGIVLGTPQPYDGNLVGFGSAYDGSGDNITNAYVDTLSTSEPVQGVYYSASPIMALNDTQLDMNGWRVAWGEQAEINLGGGDIAVISCGECNLGDQYTLTYSGTFNAGDAVGYIPYLYELNLEGTIVSTVPVPAAVWLFGSGLISLIGLSMKKRRPLAGSYQHAI